MYLHNIMKKSKNELIRKVYETQKLLPTKNDWFQLVSEDKNKLGLSVSDEQISTMSNRTGERKLFRRQKVFKKRM